MRGDSSSHSTRCSVAQRHRDGLIADLQEMWTLGSMEQDVASRFRLSMCRIYDAGFAAWKLVPQCGSLSQGPSPLVKITR